MPDLAALVPRLDPLIRRLGSDHDGERLAVVAALARVLAANNATFHDLADRIGGNAGGYQPPPPPPPGGDGADLRCRIDTLRGCDWLSRWESEFLASVGDQLAWRVTSCRCASAPSSTDSGASTRRAVSNNGEYQ